MSNSQYTELIEFLTDQFGKIEQRFQKIDHRFEQIDRRFEQIDRKFEQNDNRFDRIEVRLTKLEENQDFFLKEIVAFRQEFTVSNFRIGRIEEWVVKAAKKVELPYNT